MVGDDVRVRVSVVPVDPKTVTEVLGETSFPELTEVAVARLMVLAVAASTLSFSTVSSESLSDGLFDEFCLRSESNRADLESELSGVFFDDLELEKVDTQQRRAFVVAMYFIEHDL